MEKINDNVVALPSGWGLLTDNAVPATHVKVCFPVGDNDDGVEAENMWVRITEGSNLQGVGTLDNEPLYVDYVKLGQSLRFGISDEGDRPAYIEKVDPNQTELPI